MYYLQLIYDSSLSSSTKCSVGTILKESYNKAK